MSIMEYNGGAVVAMKGKGCVAIASDLRYGIQGMTVAMDLPKIHKINDKVYIGLAGLATDNQTLVELLRFKTNLYKLREERDIRPSVFANLVSSTLYEKRFGPYYAEPVIAGLDGPDNTPYIAAMDLIGAPLFADDFVLVGTCNQALFGMCESLYKPDLEPDDLFETVAQALLASVDRDAFSGWGAVVHVITKDQVVTRTLKARQD
eukprot:TRINITY_DN18577_c0_g1_i1.p1 TRINITY_DN18577_c0_g1~~TRINITY_DN18577_c0_g1_i1.p1  ORF type:complete len:206 (+),score=25.30 TRINITY_DN18577_c0_g1_i1:118-735(+)